ncbi:hypothetical protein BC829DRAFT_215364 [Chytridium lagenaria]|nr:hypothetical protein BC829DRAFT_215364 [Chytridium lagenaria]
MQRPHSRFSLPTSSSTGILQRTFGAMPVGAADVNGLTSLKRQRSNDAPLRERRPIHQRNPIMRKAGQPPPFARIGATTNRNRLGAAIPPQEALLAYSPPAPGADEDGNWWLYTSRILTCCICAPCLVGMGKKDIHVQQAWREKVALCIIIASIMSAVAFLSFGLQASLCPDSRGSLVSDAVLNQSDHLTLNYRNNVVIYGYIYDFGEVRDRLSGRGNIQLTSDWLGRDITSLFQPAVDACAGISTIPTPKCFVENRFPGSPSLEPNPGEPCPSYSWLEGLKPAGRAFFTWQDLSMNKEPPHTLVAFNGAVLNLTSFFRSSRDSFNPSSVAAVERVVGTDGTRGLSFSPATLAFVNCLKNRHIVGYLDKESIGCVATKLYNPFA